MTKAPYFPFFVNNWLGSARIAVMTPAEEGAYLRLLCYAWQDDKCSLPSDDASLAMLSRLGEAWNNGSGVKIKACFEEHDGRLYNEKLLELRHEADSLREKKRQGGVKGMLSRYGNKDITHLQDSYNPTPTPTPTPTDTPRATPTPRIKEDIYTSEFIQFWEAYPRKSGKKAAFTAWQKAKDKPDMDAILKAIESQKRSEQWQKDNGQFIPMPATWLNQGRWDDKPPELPKEKIPWYRRPKEERDGKAETDMG
jgi:uncharacterized protein YdaU (DUF1376 family)